MTRFEEIVQNICDCHTKCCKQIQKINQLEADILLGTHILAGWKERKSSKRCGEKEETLV